MTSKNGADVKRNLSLDIIVPIYNEADALPFLFHRLQEVFSQSACQSHGIGRIQYLIIDDGSKDNSASIVANYIKRGAPAILYRLSRNFGHQNAISAGIDNSVADLIAIIDSDLQDPPELIYEMISQYHKGYDVVYGVRKKRKENIIKRICYWFFYRLLTFLSEFNIPLDSGDFCLMGRRALEIIRGLPEKLRYPRVLRAWIGLRQIGLPYERPPRKQGRTKYTLAKLYQLATEGVASSSTRPLKVAQLFSFSFFVLTLLFILVLLLIIVFESNFNVPNSIIFAYALIAGGACVQTFCLYILGAYVGRTYLEVKGRPTYLIMEVIDGNKSSAPDNSL